MGYLDDVLPKSGSKSDVVDTTALVVSMKWAMEVYQFENSIPTSGDFTGAGAPVIIGGSVPTPSSSKKLFNGIPEFGPSNKKQDAEIETFLGITGVSLHRSKGTPDGSCSITMVGPLSPKIYVGGWAIISSITQNENGQSSSLTRFVGQIENIDISYNVGENGNIFLQSSIKIREWSAMLRMTVRYDIMALAATGFGTPGGQLQGVSDLLKSAAAGDSSHYKEISKMLNNAFDPYEIGHIILALIGSLNAQDAIQTVKSLTEDLKLPNVATTAPYIPQGLLARLGIGSGTSKLPQLGSLLSNNSKNPYQSGFVKLITGVQSEAVYNDGEWDGVFSSKNGTKIEELSKNYQTGYEALVEKVKPLTAGFQSILSSGAPAWDLLSTCCDNTVNEVFTDLLYETGSNEDDVVAKPVIFLRNRPFLLKRIRDGEMEGIKIPSDVDLSIFAVYDDLPRHKIDSRSVLNFRVNSTFLNSPNYIRINYAPGVLMDKTGEPEALNAGLDRLDAEMKRFGGNEKTLTTIYNGTDPSGIGGESGAVGTIDDWYKQLATLARAWYSYNYRMGTGILMLKENGIPLSIGNNVQFKFGQYMLVGHIEGIRCDFQVEADGSETNLTTVTLVNIVHATSIGDLDFVDMEHWGNLLHSTPVSKPASASMLQYFKGAFGLP